MVAKIAIKIEHEHSYALSDGLKCLLMIILKIIML